MITSPREGMNTQNQLLTWLIVLSIDYLERAAKIAFLMSCLLKREICPLLYFSWVLDCSAIVVDACKSKSTVLPSTGAASTLQNMKVPFPVDVANCPERGFQS